MRGRMSLGDVEALARAAHAGQTDKAGRPYEEHLRAVAEGVRALGGDEELIAAAWLHDAVEDDALSPEWLDGAPLTRRTKDIVLAVTKQTGESPESYAHRILSVPGALLVKTADLAHNAHPARLAALAEQDEPTARRLTAKYAHMRTLLGLPQEPTAETEVPQTSEAAAGAPETSSGPPPKPLPKTSPAPQTPLTHP